MAKLLSNKSYYLDAVEESIKEINQQLSGTRQVRIASKKIVIQKELKKLQEKGYKIVKTQGAEEPVVIDRESRTIQVDLDHASLEDRVVIAGNTLPVRFTSWLAESSNSPACRIARDGVLEINQDYSLFSTKRYGEIFEKIHILLLLAKKESSSVDQMFRKVVEKINQEFMDMQ